MKYYNPLISIVVLNYNGIDYLKKTIPYLLKLIYNNYEIIFVDNGSNDGSIEFIKKFKSIKLIENKNNLGYNKGKNIGIIAAKGSFVLLLDEDILINNNNYLNLILNFYQDLYLNNKIGFISPLLVDSEKKITKYYGIYYSFFGKRINKKVKLLNIKNYINNIKIGSFNGGAVFFSKILWEKIGGYDNDYFFGLDDYDIGARAYIFGFSNYLFNKELIHLGKRKDENKKHFALKYSYYYEGIVTTAFKNYELINLIIFLIIFIPYILFLNTSLIIYKKNIYLSFAPIKGLINFLKKYKYIIEKRNIIQSKRIVKNDIFLKIKSPNFNKNVAI